MTIPSQHENALAELEICNIQIAKYLKATDATALLAGGQISDKSRIDLPVDYRHNQTLMAWLDRRKKLIAKLDPQTASCCIPIGFVK